MTKCFCCFENALQTNQYFMVHNLLWIAFCRDFIIPQSALVCANCFEKKINRRIELTDLILVPVNIKFLLYRYPGVYSMFMKNTSQWLRTI